MKSPLEQSLAALIREVPDFPKCGVTFKDITPVLADPAALSLAVELMANPWRSAGVDRVVGAESRGFIFGTAIAQALSCGFVPVRKPGKLPRPTISVGYELEYGKNELHMHEDALNPGARVLMVDDVLATGGTMKACIELVRRAKATPLAAVFFIEIEALCGRALLAPVEVSSVLRF